MSDIVDDAEDLIAACFGEDVEDIPHREIMNGFAMLPGLVADIKRLREQLVSTEAEIDSWIADRDIWIARYAAKDAELARWQKIAIEERAKQMNGPCEYRTRHEWCDKLEAPCDGFTHMFYDCPIKETWRSMAAKDLGIPDAP